MPSIARKYCCFILLPPRAREPVRSKDRPAPPYTIRRSFHRFNALDQLGMLFAVFLPHRPHGRPERFLVVDLDDLDPRSLDLLDRLLFHLVPKPALVLLRFLGEFRDHRLVLLRKRVPDLL